MGWYDKHILPWVLDKACSTGSFRWERKQLLPTLQGTVVEIGIGSGLNLPHYPETVTKVIGIEPDEGMLKKAQPRADAAPFPVELMQGVAEALPLEDQSTDTLLLTFTLCTLPDVPGALREFRRVLRPNGRLLFAEHGRSPDPGVARWQDRLNGLWKPLAGGCNLNREILTLLEDGGFAVEELHQGYLRRTPRTMGFVSRGIARPIPNPVAHQG